MKASGIFRKNNFRNEGGVSNLNDRNSIGFSKSGNSGGVTLHTQAVEDGPVVDRVVAVHGRPADIPMIEVPRTFLQPGHLESTILNGCIKAIAGSNAIDCVSESVEFENSASINAGINAIQGFGGMPQAVVDKGKQVVFSERRVVVQSPVFQSSSDGPGPIVTQPFVFNGNLQVLGQGVVNGMGLGVSPVQQLPLTDPVVLLTSSERGDRGSEDTVVVVTPEGVSGAVVPDVLSADRSLPVRRVQ
ncbi:hypothetical protein Q3G72_030304 [Acer saccharum]|nr:hypothetical protein Q3G72_030304 [Acer saccharum]